MSHMRAQAADNSDRARIHPRVHAKSLFLLLLIVTIDCACAGKSQQDRDHGAMSIMTEIAAQSRQGDVLDYITAHDREFQLLSSSPSIALAKSPQLDRIQRVIDRQRDITLASLSEKLERAIAASSLEPEDVQSLREQLHTTRAMFDHLRTIYASPVEIALQKSREFLASDEGQSPIAVAVVPLFDQAAIRAARSEVARSMILAQHELRTRGQAAFERIVDPASGEPFELQIGANEMTLTSRLVIDRARFHMTFPTLH